MAVALTVAERALNGRGACRGHGGGLARTHPALGPLGRLASSQSPVVGGGRDVGRSWEGAALRRRLGRSPGPSTLRWRETLLYLPLLALICVAAPLLARWVDGTFVVDVPVFSGLLSPFAVLPAAGFCSGFSLGRREGFCPLYPLAGGLLYVPVALIAYNHTALFHSLLFALPALAGNAAGGAWRRVKRK